MVNSHSSLFFLSENSPAELAGIQSGGKDYLLGTVRSTNLPFMSPIPSLISVNV